LCIGSSGTPPSCRNKHRNWQWPISCQIVARQPRSLPISVLVWVRYFIEPDLFENNVPFDNTTTFAFRTDGTNVAERPQGARWRLSALTCILYESLFITVSVRRDEYSAGDRTRSGWAADWLHRFIALFRCNGEISISVRYDEVYAWGYSANVCVYRLCVAARSNLQLACFQRVCLWRRAVISLVDLRCNVLGVVEAYWLYLCQWLGVLYSKMSEAKAMLHSRKWVTGSWVIGSNGSPFYGSPGSRVNVRSPVSHSNTFILPYGSHAWTYKKLIRRWNSERELPYGRHRTRTAKYNRLVHKLRHRSMRLCCNTGLPKSVK